MISFRPSRTWPRYGFRMRGVRMELGLGPDHFVVRGTFASISSFAIDHAAIVMPSQMAPERIPKRREEDGLVGSRADLALEERPAAGHSLLRGLQGVAVIVFEGRDVPVVENGGALGTRRVPAFRKTEDEKEPHRAPRLLPFPEDARPLPGELGVRAGRDGRLGDEHGAG